MTRNSRRKRLRADAATANGNKDCWICPLCTLQNSVHRRRCEACEARRPVSNTSNASLEASTIPSATEDNDLTVSSESFTDTQRLKRKAPVATWLVNRRRRRKILECTSPQNSTEDTPVCATLQLIKVRLKDYPDEDENTTSLLQQECTNQLEALVPDNFSRRLPSAIKDVTVQLDETSQSSLRVAQQLEHKRLEKNSRSCHTSNNTIKGGVTKTYCESTNPVSSDWTKVVLHSTVRSNGVGCTSLNTSGTDCVENLLTNCASKDSEDTLAVPPYTSIVKVRIRGILSIDISKGLTDEQSGDLLEALIPCDLIIHIQLKANKSLAPRKSSDGSRSPLTLPCQLQGEGTNVNSPANKCNHNDGPIDRVAEKQPSLDLSTLDTCGDGTSRAVETVSPSCMQNCASLPDTTTSEASPNNGTSDLIEKAETKSSSQGTAKLESLHHETHPLKWSVSETSAVLMDGNIGEYNTKKNQQQVNISGNGSICLYSRIPMFSEAVSPKRSAEFNIPRSFMGESPECGQLNSKVYAESYSVIQKNKHTPSDQQCQYDQGTVCLRGTKQHAAESTDSSDLTESCLLPEVSSKSIGYDMGEKMCMSLRFADYDAYSETKASGSQSYDLIWHNVEANTQNQIAIQSVTKSSAFPTGMDLRTKAYGSQSREMRRNLSESASEERDHVITIDAESKENADQCDGEKNHMHGDATEDISSESVFRATPQENKEFRKPDTPSTRSWQPITQNDGTLAAGPFVYTPSSQPQECSCSQDTLSQEYTWTGQSQTPDASVDVKNLPRELSISKMCCHENFDDEQANESVLNTFLGVSSCERVSRVNKDSQLFSSGHGSSISPLTTRDRVVVNDGYLDANIKPCDEKHDTDPAVDSMSSELVLQNGRNGKTHHCEESSEGVEQMEYGPSPPPVSFQTAGMKKEIVLDEMALSRARTILSESSRQPMPVTRYQNHRVSPICTPQSEFTISKATSRFSFHAAGEGNALEAQEDMRRARTLRLEGPSNRRNSWSSELNTPDNTFRCRGPACVSFQTAGKGRVIEAQEKDMEKVRQMFTNLSSNIAWPAAGEHPEIASLLKTSKISAFWRMPHKSLHSDDVKECGDASKGQKQKPMAQVVRRVSPNFETSGMPKNIEVSTARNLRADLPSPVDGTLRTDKSMKTPGREHHIAGLSCVSFQKVDQKQTLEAPEMEVQGARDLLSGSIESTALNRNAPTLNFINPQVTPSGFVPSRLAFQTAGKREIIEVAEEELEPARKLLASTLSRNSFYVDKASQTVFDPATSGNRTLSSKAPRKSFQTAGKGQIVEAFEDDLLRARDLLSASPRVKTKDYHSSLPVPLHVQKLCSGRSPDPKTCDGWVKHNASIRGPRRVSFHTAGNGKAIDTPKEGLEQVKHLFSSTAPDQQFYWNESKAMTREFKTPGPETRKSYSAVVTFPSERKQGHAGVVEVGSALPQDLASRTPHVLSNLRTPVSESMQHRPARLSFDHAPRPSTVKDLERDPRSRRFCDGMLKHIDPSTEAPRIQGHPFIEPKHIDCQVGDITSCLGVPLRETKKMIYSHASEVQTGASPLLQSNSDETKENLSPGDCVEGLQRVPLSLAIDTPGLPRKTAKQNMTKSRLECVEYGVAQILLSIDGENGSSVCFGDDGLPVNLSVPNNETERKVRQEMVKKGCDYSKISSKWIKNHCRWICWKLASLERRFPHLLERPYFTLQRLLDRLLHRFKKELVVGLRSPLRKILNRDVAPSSMMILCVAKLNLSQKKPADCDNSADDPSHTIELTDGWYSIFAKPDRFLCELIDRSQIRVGTKLLVSNSSLHGSEDGIDPLDDEYQCSSETYLRLFTNSTRLASWDSKLGFVKMNYFQKEICGSLHIRSMRDLVEGGGRVPSIDFTIVKKYPLLFLHRAKNGKSCVLTESEEENRLHRLEDDKAKLADEIFGELEEDCSKDVDEMAPPEWKDMMLHPCPDDFLSDLSEDKKKNILSWQDRRKQLIIERIRQELEARFEEHGLSEEPSKPFAKFLIQDTGNSSKGVHYTDSCPQALLTVWGPSTCQLELLKEQTTVRARQLSVKENKFDELIQLSAESRTIFVETSKKSLAASIGSDSIMSRNSPIRGIFQTCLMSKRYGQKEKSSSQMDIVGTALRVEESYGCWKMYLTDRSGMVLRVDSAAPFCKQTEPSYTTLCIRSIEIGPFDVTENVGVATYGPESSLSNELESPVLQRLARWLCTEEARKQVKLTFFNFMARVPTKAGVRKSQVVFLAYLVEFAVLESKHLIVKVDAGEQDLIELDLPLRLLAKIDTDSSGVVLGPTEEFQMSRLSRLGKLFRARSLHRIVVIQLDQPIPGHEKCTHQIVDLSIPNPNDLMAWYVNIGIKQSLE